MWTIALILSLIGLSLLLGLIAVAIDIHQGMKRRKRYRYTRPDNVTDIRDHSSAAMHWRRMGR
jgi:hypothetical protein